MKLPILLTRKKLRAATVSRQRILGGPEYEEMSEPNMKLSRALLIVLVLHVVAVAGIVAFNTIKTRESPAPPPVSAPEKISAEKSGNVPATVAASPELASTPVPHPAQATAEHSAPKPSEKIAEHAKPAAVDPSKIYVVGKGDNPVTIARKLKVSYDDLLALNHIDDPHKLQIGQKLLIPPKKPKPKHSGE
jgi:nucleoid-associated protein YgaU